MTLGVSPGGRVVLVWRAADLDSEGNGLQVGPLFAAVRRDDGAFSPRQRISAPGEDAHHALLAVAPDGAALAVWAAGFGDEEAAPVRSVALAAGSGALCSLLAPSYCWPNVRAAVEIADRAYVLDDGRVVYSGAAAEFAKDEERVRALAGASAEVWEPQGSPA